MHQEDLCQAKAIHPSFKYQSDGGPSIKDIAHIIWNVSSDAQKDIHTFTDALILNYLISGTDAHAKNYSLLLAGGNQVRLAPLYDIASILPYPKTVSPHKAKLAMKIGSTYHISKIETRHWEACAKQLRLPASFLLERISTLSQKVTTLAPQIAEQLHRENLTHPVIQQLSNALTTK